MARRASTQTTQVSQGRRRPNVPRIDELPAGIPADGTVDPLAEARAAAVAQRGHGSGIAAGEPAQVIGRLGGLVKAAQDRGLRALEGLGLKGAAPEFLAPYLADAEAFAMSEIGRLSAEAGKGICGPMPASMVQSAALELAGSRAAFASGAVLLGSKLAGASRANLLCAFDLCVKQAIERPEAPQQPPAEGYATTITSDQLAEVNKREIAEWEAQHGCKWTGQTADD